MNDQFRVLLIEDNAGLLRMIGDMLAQSPAATFYVELATRLSDGLERLANGGIDIILLDLMLPDARGLETFTECYNRAPEVPVVVLTALEDESIALSALRGGAQDYVIKTELNPRSLIRSIRYAIERKRGEEARSRLAAIVESSHDAIIGLSLEGLIVSWNTGAEAIFGHSFEDVIGRPSGVLIAPGKPDEMPEILRQLKSGQFIRDFDTVRRTKEGHEAQVAISVSPIKNSFGRIIGASMIARDIDEQKRHEQEREHLIGELKEALAQVNMLTGLLPICASCKKIRDDQGYWTQVEVYVMAHSQAEFTHGICPECDQRYRSEMNPPPLTSIPPLEQTPEHFMNLDDSQKKTVAAWISSGLQLSEIQKRLGTELGLNLTYMEVRLLVDDLKLMPKDLPPKVEKNMVAASPIPSGSPLAAPAAARPPQKGGLPEVPAPASGSVSVTVDSLARAGAVVSGAAKFSDGQTATWYLDQYGRMGLAPTQTGYKPSAADMQVFQQALEQELGKLGY